MKPNYCIPRSALCTDEIEETKISNET